VQDAVQVEAVITTVFAKNSQVANDVRNGKIQAVGPLAGHVELELKGGKRS